jgi:hypothetical protein
VHGDLLADMKLSRIGIEATRRATARSTTASELGPLDSKSFSDSQTGVPAASGQSRS